MTREEAIQVCNDVRLLFWSLSDKVKDAMKMAIEALKQQEQNSLPDKVGEETDDKYKYFAEKFDKVEEIIQQLEKDVNRLENSRTIEVRPVYPNAPLTGISAYAGPEFNGLCTGLPTNSSTTLLWSRNEEDEK